MFEVEIPEVDPVTVYSLWHGGVHVRGKLSHKTFPGMTIYVEKWRTAQIEPGTMLNLKHERRGVIGQVEYQPGAHVVFTEGE